MDGYGLVSQKIVDGVTYTVYRGIDDPNDILIEDDKPKENPMEMKAQKIDMQEAKVRSVSYSSQTLREYWGNLGRISQ